VQRVVRSAVTLIAAIAFALPHHPLGLGPAVDRERSANMSLPSGELSFFAANIALVAQMRLDQLAWHGQSLLGFFYNNGLNGKVSL
jgi:hypothetical protein